MPSCATGSHSEELSLAFLARRVCQQQVTLILFIWKGLFHPSVRKWFCQTQVSWLAVFSRGWPRHPPPSGLHRLWREVSRSSRRSPSSVTSRFSLADVKILFLSTLFPVTRLFVDLFACALAGGRRGSRMRRVIPFADLGEFSAAGVSSVPSAPASHASVTREPVRPLCHTFLRGPVRSLGFLLRPCDYLSSYLQARRRVPLPAQTRCRTPPARSSFWSLCFSSPAFPFGSFIKISISLPTSSV